MKKYRNLDTGEIWTEEEVKESFEQFKDEIIDDAGNPKYSSYEEYMEEMLSQGRQRIGGLEEVEE